MTTEAVSSNRRRVRPWIAALLTFVGWGVGFYYARNGAALRWAITSVLVSLALAAAVLAYASYVDPGVYAFLSPNGDVPTYLSLLITVPVAVVAWIATAKNQEVDRGGAVRLLGYLFIWLIPVLGSLVVAMAIRFTTVQPFRMPSGSMQPTLAVGDYFLVTKWSYGYSRFSVAPFQGLLPPGRVLAHAPRRGDLAVFRPASEPDRDFVKRIVGLPGDRIQMIGGVLHINGQPVPRESLGLVSTPNQDGGADEVQAYRETLANGVSFTTLDRTENGELDNTRVFVVPANHYFMLGDDRDNSADSRVPSVVGYVPFDNLVGRVDRIFSARRS